jgi:hypothetical protein
MGGALGEEHDEGVTGRPAPHRAGDRRVMAAGKADEAAATDRLRRALLAFRAAQARFLAAHRKAKALASADEVERFWATQGGGIEAAQRAAAAEVAAAFKAFSAAGLVAEAADRHLVSEAQRLLAERG